MNYFFDTEFHEDGKTITLISIGVVAEDGREFYRINYDFKEADCNDWVKANVLPHLEPRPELWKRGEERGNWRNHSRIGVELREFVGDDQSPAFWADFGAYDWVALCQLFGAMLDLPSNFPYFVRDVQQFKEFARPSNDDGDRADIFVKEWYDGQPGGTEHNALNDARECKRRYDLLVRTEQESNTQLRSALVKAIQERNDARKSQREMHRQVQQVQPQRDRLLNLQSQYENTIIRLRDHNAALSSALKSAVTIAQDAYAEWDSAPEAMKPGKILAALSGKITGYREDADEIHGTIARLVTGKPPVSAAAPQLVAQRDRVDNEGPL